MTKVIVEATRGLRVREKPTVFSRVVAGLPYHSIVDVTEKSGVWGKVPSKHGWIHLGYTSPWNPDDHPVTEWLDEPLVDISHYQPCLRDGFWCGQRIPWAVVLKASQGTDIQDATFCYRYRTLSDIGWHRATYHFAEPLAPWRGQAEMWKKAIASAGRSPTGEHVALDWEWYVPKSKRITARANLLDLLKALDDMTGRPTWVYTGKYVWDYYFADYDAVEDVTKGRPLWLASYGRGAPRPPVGWKAVDVWQYTPRGTWSGILNQFWRPKDVDLSHVNKTFAENYRW